MNLPEHKYFFAVHGKKAKTLNDLRKIIFEISDHNFKHHVTSEKNDFAYWIRDILHKDYLANRLEKVNTKSEIIELIDDEILSDKERDITGSVDFKRFIVREFIYGMLFGIIIGMVITQLL